MNLQEAIAHRRTRYSIRDASPISIDEIKKIVDFAVLHVPSAFNSQSARVVLLLNAHHKRLWDLVLEELRVIVPADKFPASQDKINGSFKCGYGTLLFFEDQERIATLQKTYPTYEDKFPGWSLQSSGMLQYVLWTLLEEAGLGASLQHYNPLIDQKVHDEWKINPQWRLIAEMPFGTPVVEPGNKEYDPLESRVLMFQ